MVISSGPIGPQVISTISPSIAVMVGEGVRNSSVDIGHLLNILPSRLIVDHFISLSLTGLQ